MAELREIKAPKPREFRFLKSIDPLLAEYGADAARYVRSRPAESLTNSRRFAEYLVYHISDKENLHENGQDSGEDEQDTAEQNFFTRLKRLESVPRISSRIVDDLHQMRKRGNLGVHAPRRILKRKERREHKQSLSDEAARQVQRAHRIGKWFQAQYEEPSRFSWFRSFFR